MKKYEPMDNIAIRLTGKGLSSQTKNRWVQGKNIEGRRLHAIKINGCLHCTEEDLIAFLTVGGGDEAKPASQPKTRSEAARAKAVAAANAELERAGV